MHGVDGKMARSKADLTGQKFGSLTAIEYSHSNENHLAYWKYQCVCGNIHVARANTIRYESKKGDPQLPSCGCIELARKTKHGYRKSNDTHPLYSIYQGMMDRCYNTNCPNYKWYGGVGVTVCDEWKNKPQAFIEWGLNNNWKPLLHIDKDILCDELTIHPHIYSPKTCQFISAKENVSYATNRDNYGNHLNIKLSNQDVKDILDLYDNGLIRNQIAHRYEVDFNTIDRIIKMRPA